MSISVRYINMKDEYINSIAVELETGEAETRTEEDDKDYSDSKN